ncbi:hypothetical protein PHYSODRAFT_285377 [Phytophthora sojae]|uniref:Uncharacterized protein n=1 Tax=Phytophthora sojae (strain P6497) TaxID=1094619 RepID=G4Z4G3_PHYSP|nr:hypothetical protein PHYSODRAFT_285377 [Phytophthora sojae]EGZ20167.1 hypothetical protein PHYSODRAFT_285377 [Phytophthora sojae]|eukprot:XP_009522884.1 hypothetical protein PHYSODRAFT_285377 [Phytophthora sojae]
MLRPSRLEQSTDDATDFLHTSSLAQRYGIDARLSQIRLRKAAGARALRAALADYGISAPAPCPTTCSSAAAGPPRYQLDQNKQAAYSEYLRRSGTSLADFVRLLRGERPSYPGPNKALQVPTNVPAWKSYRFAAQWAAIVRHGVMPEWEEIPPSQQTPPPNHGSARRALNALVKNIRKGQDEDRYLVLDVDLLERLDGVFCSPFGAVPKDDKPLTEDARVIHDLSFPLGDR